MMKKIILIGDSTRMGYDKYVKDALQGSAEVYYAPENGRNSTNVLRFAHDWKRKYEWPTDADIVLWNAGLWDLLELFGDGPLVPLSHYRDNVPRIDKRLRMLFPNAKIVFVTSVSIVESSYSTTCKRRNSLIEEYNRAAIEALSDTDSGIFDLHAATKNCPESYRTDGTHFYTDVGREFVGGVVLSFLCSELGIPAGEVNIASFDPEKYSPENIGY